MDAALAPQLAGRALSIYDGKHFTYRFAYKLSASHYHEAGAPGAADEAYHLGTFAQGAAAQEDEASDDEDEYEDDEDDEAAAKGSAQSQQQVAAAMPALEALDLLPGREMQRSSWPYLRHMYLGGDRCDLERGRSRSRQVEARLACSPDGELRLLIREPEFCKYIFVVYSPALCELDAFKPRPSTGSTALSDDRRHDD